MGNTPSEEASRDSDFHLKGTTYRVYRFMLKEGRPVGISDVQRGLGLSSPSVSQYHIKKLLRLGLIKEEQAGYVVDRLIVESVIRIGRTSIPIQAGYVMFFATTMLLMITLFKPAIISSSYFFAMAVNVSALAISLYETRKTWRRL